MRVIGNAPMRFNQPPTVRSGETPGRSSSPDHLSLFQSAPDGEVGGDAFRSGRSISKLRFQSAPDGEVGGDFQLASQPQGLLSFNQPPTVRSGETRGRSRLQAG